MRAEKSFKRDYLLLCAQASLFSFSIAATAAMIPSIAAHFSRSPLYMGRLTWVYMVPYGLCALVWGPLTHYARTKHLLLTALAGFSLASLLVGCAQTVAQAFSGTFLLGVFGSSVIPLTLIIIGKHLADNKGKYVGALFSATYVSSLAGVLLSGVLSWRLIYGIPAVAGLCLIPLCALRMRPFDLRNETYRFSYHRTLKQKQVYALLGLIFCSSYAYHSVQQWLGVYATAQYAAPQFLTSMFLSLSSCAALFLEFLGGFWSDRAGKGNVFRLGTIMMGVCLIVLLIVRPVSFGYLFLVIPLWGGGWAMAHVGLSSALTSLPDAYLRDTSSLNSAIRFVAGGLGVFLSGKFIAVLGFPAHFIVVSFLLLGIIVLSMSILKDNG